MTAKRFINDIDNGKLIDTKGELSTIYYSDSVDFYELWEFLNKLSDENEQLRKSIKRQQSSNDECAKLIKEQQKENEQLKAINKYLIEILEHNGATVEIEHIKGDVE